MNTYMSGTLVRSSAEFVNILGADADPTTTTFKYRAGAGSIVTPAPVHDGAGVFHSDIDTTGWTGPGNLLYTLQWQGAGNVVAIDSDYFEVEPPAL